MSEPTLQAMPYTSKPLARRMRASVRPSPSRPEHTAMPSFRAPVRRAYSMVSSTRHQCSSNARRAVSEAAAMMR